MGEVRYGIESRDLIESALARPKHSAVYENADIIRQSATLLFGLVKNHPWRGGNKRTATTILRRFLELNGYQRNWAIVEQIELVLAVESDAWKVDEIENWLRSKASKLIGTI
ncbi:MAG: type II toxin-antitoxin system death-on-curing family toxin [Acidobacteriota bacterium]|nr:type II toxin-antitoxin system death-on-curing family toxin [Acidobacteriota bacterium]